MLHRHPSVVKTVHHF